MSSHALSFRRLLGLCSLLLAACSSTPPLPDLPTDAPADFPLARYQPGPGTVLAVQEAELELRVFRGGRLKHLGHNHVITSQALAGLARYSDGDPTQRYADLYLPLESLRVDEPAARAAAGDAFSSTPSAKDRDGTRRNMLGPKLLNAAQHPYLRVTVRAIEPDRAIIQLLIAGQPSEHEVPLETTLEGDRVGASARFDVTHEALGLEPFSVLGGAIAVADPIEVRLTLKLAPSASSGSVQLSTLGSIEQRGSDYAPKQPR